MKGHLRIPNQECAHSGDKHPEKQRYHTDNHNSDQGNNPGIEITFLYLMIQSVVFRGFLRSIFVLNVLHIPTFMEVFRKLQIGRAVALALSF